MAKYYMYHPESESLWIEHSEEERDACIDSDGCVEEIDEQRYYELERRNKDGNR